MASRYPRQLCRQYPRCKHQSTRHWEINRLFFLVFAHQYFVFDGTSFIYLSFSSSFSPFFFFSLSSPFPPSHLQGFFGILPPPSVFGLFWAIFEVCRSDFLSVHLFFPVFIECICVGYADSFTDSFRSWKDSSRLLFIFSAIVYCLRIGLVSFDVISVMKRWCNWCSNCITSATWIPLQVSIRILWIAEGFFHRFFLLLFLFLFLFLKDFLSDFEEFPLCGVFNGISFEVNLWIRMCWCVSVEGGRDGGASTGLIRRNQLKQKIQRMGNVGIE